MANLPYTHREAIRPLIGAATLALGLVLAAAALPGYPAAACLPAAPEQAVVEEVRDARTLLLADGRLIRPAAVDSFALLGDHIEAADAYLADRLKALLAGRRVGLKFVTAAQDRYGRRAAHLVDESGLFQARLAEEGAAITVPGAEAGGCIAELLASEAAARRARRGGWAKVGVAQAEPGALSPHLGGYVIFEGKVLSVGNRSRRTYLNFGRRWSEDVTVVIEAADRDRFGGTESLANLAGRRVRVRGFVEEWGGPLVVARWPGQIEILDTAEGEGDGS